MAGNIITTNNAHDVLLDLGGTKSGAVLPTGIFLLSSFSGTVVTVYDTDFNALATPLQGTAASNIVVSAGTSLFCVVNDAGGAGVYDIYLIDDTGTIQTSIPAAPNIPAVTNAQLQTQAMTLDGSTLLYASPTSTSSDPYTKVASYNLGTQMANATFADEGPLSVNGICMLADSTDVLVCWDDTDPADNVVIRYDNAGMEVDSFPTPNARAICTDPSGESFWYKDALSDPDLVVQVDATTGDVLQTLTGNSAVAADATFFILPEPVGLNGITPNVPPTYPQPPDPAVPSLDGPVRRLHRFPLPNSENKWVFCSLLELEFQRGLAPITGQGFDPIMMLRISRDGGQTWGPLRLADAGPQGHYSQRVRWLRNGRFRNGVAELTMSDPIPWFLVDMYGEFDEGTS